MTAFPSVPDQLATVAALDALLAGHGISYWLFGGWAVDFHAGRVTREHADIDIAVWAVDHGHLRALSSAVTRGRIVPRRARTATRGMSAPVCGSR
ncbi:hypothetical protein tb265_40700 [Gemmatimonadetes bacterium T265]|nr:hypothetical protein tb265_40700 [Gemmatimonadetes bacterium T265]